MKRSLLCYLLFAFASPAIAATPVSGDPVLYWNEVTYANVPGSPPVRDRILAIVNIAIFEAVNASLSNPNKTYVGPVANNGGDTRAAASVAARNALVALDPARTATYDAALTASLALIPNGTAKDNGIATGAAMAAAIIAARTNDGAGATVLYTPSGLPGGWAPTPANNAPAVLTQWGNVTPFVLSSGDQFRPAPPPGIDSAAYAVDFNEVKDIGSATSATRSADQTEAATFWATANLPWSRIAIDRAEASGQSSLANAAMLTTFFTALSDAEISVFNAKYYYDLWRPVTAIRGADLDGNAATTSDPTWLAFLTNPAYPAYVSGADAQARTAATILAAYLGDNQNFCGSVGVIQRCWTSFSSAATETGNSRIWGGIHYRFDIDASDILATSIAGLALSRDLFGAVPEPMTWLSMTVGFGTIGALTRRRRRRLAAVMS